MITTQEEEKKMKRYVGEEAIGIAMGLKGDMEEKGYEWYDDPYKLNIIGVRSPAKRAGRFDDKCWCISQDESGRLEALQYDISCDPGPRYLRRPINRAGCAILAPGQYRKAYKIGLHRRKYRALIQRGGPVKVYRDDNKDGFLDHAEESAQVGWYGINLHHAGGDYDFGDKFRGASAGCQVWASKTEFEQFMSLCKRHRRHHGNEFTYTLLEECGPDVE